MLPIILYEDNFILVCEKPAGLPSQSGKTAEPDMVSLLKNYLYEKYPGKGEPYVGIVHRLDCPVGGVMVFAKTSSAAGHLSEQIKNGKIEKKYLAVLCADLSADLPNAKASFISLTDYLAKDARSNLSKITSPNDRSSKKAKLLYRVLAVLPAEDPALSLAEIELITGRHHQIRVQMSAHTGAIWGDTKYNNLFRERGKWFDLALYAYSLTFQHPDTKKLLSFQSLPSHDIFIKFGNNLLNICPLERKQ